jgi:dUTP pyrophosphatase
MVKPTLGFYCIPDTGAETPKFATDGSACFDICARFHSDPKNSDPDWGAYKPVIAYGPQNIKTEIYPTHGILDVPPGWRFLVPTGLVLDIPEGYSVRLHARSGMALKEGFVLSNAEGVIDSDYTDELMVMVSTYSSCLVCIPHGARICQAELVRNQPVDLIKIANPPLNKTQRTGGFGSTGLYSWDGNTEGV